jgi:hypothetical protein
MCDSHGDFELRFAAKKRGNKSIQQSSDDQITFLICGEAFLTDLRLFCERDENASTSLVALMPLKSYRALASALRLALEEPNPMMHGRGKSDSVVVAACIIA